MDSRERRGGVRYRRHFPCIIGRQWAGGVYHRGTVPAQRRRRSVPASPVSLLATFVTRTVTGASAPSPSRLSSSSVLGRVRVALPPVISSSSHLFELTSAQNAHRPPVRPLTSDCGPFSLHSPQRASPGRRCTAHLPRRTGLSTVALPPTRFGRRRDSESPR